MFLTHPHLSEATLAQLDLQPQGLPGDLPRILGQALGLRLGCGTHGSEAVTQAISMFWRRKQGIGFRQDPTATWLPCPVCMALGIVCTLALGTGRHSPINLYSPRACGTKVTCSNLSFVQLPVIFESIEPVRNRCENLL